MKSVKNNEYYQGLGRRKSSVATVRLYRFGKKESIQVKQHVLKKGDILVNFQPVDTYFKQKTAKMTITEPLRLTETAEMYGIIAFVKGGGMTAQMEALRLAIAKALIGLNKDFKPTLKKSGLVTRDARVKERRKVGTGGQARHKKQSPKR